MKHSKHYLPILILAVLIFLVSCASSTPTVTEPAATETVAQPNDPDPLRYPAAFETFHSADSTNPSQPGVLLFVGSSSIRGWKTLEEDLSDYDVLNRGFGGSHFSDLLYHIENLVFVHEPGAIFVYEGDNDIAWGKTPQRVYEDYLMFVKLVRERWAETPIFFIAIKPSIDRIQLMDEMAQANSLIRSHTEADETLHFVDVFSIMLDETGKPREDIFIQDGLHMNETGYDLWEAAVKKVLE